MLHLIVLISKLMVGYLFFIFLIAYISYYLLFKSGFFMHNYTLKYFKINNNIKDMVMKQ